MRGRKKEWKGKKGVNPSKLGIRDQYHANSNQGSTRALHTVFASIDLTSLYCVALTLLQIVPYAFEKMDF